MENTECAVSLTLREQKSCLLAWVEGLSDAAIAERHGVKRRTIETRLYRARRKMRQAGIEPPPRIRVATRSQVFRLGDFENV